MFLELFFVLASGMQEPSKFGTLAKAHQCAEAASDPAILTRQIAKAKAVMMDLNYSEAEADAVIEENLNDARAANLPAPTEEECQALK
jgi:hypothetical protein